MTPALELVELLRAKSNATSFRFETKWRGPDAEVKCRIHVRLGRPIMRALWCAAAAAMVICGFSGAAGPSKPAVQSTAGTAAVRVTSRGLIDQNLFVTLTGDISAGGQQFSGTA